jgi:hypothetical protein
VSQLIKRLLLKCGWTKAVPNHAVGWSMQFRELSTGCKVLVMGNGTHVWIVGLTDRDRGSCYGRSLS